MSVLASVPKLQKQSFPSRSLAPSRLSSTRGQSWAHFLLRGRIRNHQQPPPSLSFQNCPEQTDCCLIILQSLLAARLQELLLQDHCIYFRSVKRKPIICSSDGPILRVQQVLLPTCLMPWSRLSSVLQTDRLAEPTAATASSEHLTSPSLSLYFPSWKSLSRMYCTSKIDLQHSRTYGIQIMINKDLLIQCLIRPLFLQDSKIFRVQPTWAYQRPLG